MAAGIKSIKAVLNSDDVTTAAAVPIYLNGASTEITIASTDELRVESVSLSWAHAAGDVHVYFSTDGTNPASWQTIARGGAGTGTGFGLITQQGLNFTAPPGYKIYAKAGVAGVVSVVIKGSILRK